MAPNESDTSSSAVAELLFWARHKLPENARYTSTPSWQPVLHEQNKWGDMLQDIMRWISSSWNQWLGVYRDKLLGLKDSGLNEQLSLAALKMLVRRSERQKIPEQYSTRMKPPVTHQTLDSSLFFEKKTKTHTWADEAMTSVTLNFVLGAVCYRGKWHS